MHLRKESDSYSAFCFSVVKSEKKNIIFFVFVFSAFIFLLSNVSHKEVNTVLVLLIYFSDLFSAACKIFLFLTIFAVYRTSLLGFVRFQFRHLIRDI